MAGELSRRLAREFEPAVRQRGENYYRAKKIWVDHIDEQSVQTLVKGSSTYNVELRLEGNSLHASCDCPFFYDHGPCKHLWATILAADEADALGAVRNVRSLEFVLDDEDGYYDDEPDEDEDDEDAWRGNSVRQAAFPFGLRSNMPMNQLPEALVRHALALQQQQKNRQQRQNQPSWKNALDAIRENPTAQAFVRNHDVKEREIYFIVDIPQTMAAGELTVSPAIRQRTASGEFGKIKPARLTGEDIRSLEEPEHRAILASLQGARGENYGYYGNELSGHLRLPDELSESLLPRILRTGRAVLRASEADREYAPLTLDDGAAWRLTLDIRKVDKDKAYAVSGVLHRENEEMPLSQPHLVTAGGWVVWKDRVCRFADNGIFPWVAMLRKVGEISVPAKDADAFLCRAHECAVVPPLRVPPELTFEEIVSECQPCLSVKKEDSWQKGILLAKVSFEYSGIRFAWDDPRKAIWKSAERALVRRNGPAEREAARLLAEHHVQPNRKFYRPGDHACFTMHAKHLPDAVRALMAVGWRVEAEGKLYRSAGTFKIAVSSGTDWFEVRANADFDGISVPFPALLEALRNGDNTVVLDDGSVGLLPEDWLKRHGLLIGTGKVSGDHLRFQKYQAGLLDALLLAAPEANCDATFNKVRKELQSFQSIQPGKQPRGFQGMLRDYQLEGVGWFEFLNRFSFGGCLADDMGLGKTVQVLALLESLRAKRKTDGPRCSLVVAPRSVLYNWRDEAERFAPKLRVLTHAGLERNRDKEVFSEYDLVLTTYGTLRRDITIFREQEFAYAILDEAQAIKNADTETAKAARLLNARRRLGLSGTPIENHLGELWSLFEFLNPGMLGTSSVFQRCAADNPDQETRTLLSRALRPFILRRTKGQVARELPERVEQTVYCELEGKQRKEYDELRDHYRQMLMSKIDLEGINKAKFIILEALLRLRQAACHPGLIDKKRVNDGSAKLDALMAQLSEVVEGGHKALVFSQFTSLLAILKPRLDAEKIPYEYLDGRTRDRAAKVRHFQEDEGCSLFLISLKAGGLGLNLTAAEYVFLLDPWWNPAVEAQAIDRAHRIGQTKNVFAYRLIAKDTVEEKVLELQKGKRELADAILNEDNSLIRNLTSADLELLLS